MHFTPGLANKIERLLSIPIERRKFLSGVSGALALTVLPLSSCNNTKSSTDLIVFSKDQKSLLRSVQEHLFPKEELAPGAMDIHAADYLELAINQPGFDPEIRDFIFSGVDHILKYTKEHFHKSFLQLRSNSREEILLNLLDESWGSNWISTILSYIFEALLSDPVYGGNPDEIGWRWLEHIPGNPRPDAHNRYGASS